jgi:hypothetical protein
MVMVNTLECLAVSPKRISNILPRICESVVNSVTHRSKNDQDPTKCVTGFRVSWGSYPDFGRFVTLKFVSDPCQYINRKRTGEIDLFRIILGDQFCWVFSDFLLLAVLHPSAWRRPWEHPGNENNVVAQEHTCKMDCKRVSFRVGM